MLYRPLFLSLKVKHNTLDIKYPAENYRRIDVNFIKKTGPISTKIYTNLRANDLIWPKNQLSL